MGAAALGGCAAEWALLTAGAVTYPAHASIGWPVPLWMPALWANFASILNYSLSWLRGRWAAAAMLGAIAGPLSYLAGSRLGALTMPSETYGAALVALEWAIATPALLWLAGRRSV